VQILGAEKALFRALKTKHETPKYGLIYHASLVGSAAPKFKGKISRVLASKCSLAIRYDALGEGDDATVGIAGRAKVEMRLRQLEGGTMHAMAGVQEASKIQKYTPENGAVASYNTASDSTLGDDAAKKKAKKDKKDKKRKAADGDGDEAPKKKKKKEKKEGDDEAPKKKKKKEKKEEGGDEEPKKKKKKKKDKA
jgi:nucleolar protein 58